MAITSQQQHFLESFLKNNPSYQAGIFDIYQPPWKGLEFHAPFEKIAEDYYHPQITSTRRKVPAFSTIKSYAEDPELDTAEKIEEARKEAYGYTRPYFSPDIFIRDIEKFGPAWGPNPTEQGFLNEQIAGTIGHEYGHQTLMNDPRFADIKEMVLGDRFKGDNPYGASTKDYLESGIQGLGTKHMTNELFNRLIDLRNAENLKSRESRRDLDYIESMLQGDEDFFGGAGTKVPWQNIANPHLKARPMSMQEFFKITNPAQVKYMDRVKQIKDFPELFPKDRIVPRPKDKVTTYQGPPTTGGRDYQPQRPTRPGGFTDPGKGSYGPWKAKGGIIDKALSGRSRYI